MQYRPYGKHTDIMLSTLAFGAMRLPRDDDYAVECMVRAIDLGVNFLDTASGYSAGPDNVRGHSEVLVGRAMKCRPREELYLSTKNWVGEDSDADSWRRQLEGSLERLDTDYIDFYQVYHSASWEGYNERFKPKGKGLEAAVKARDEGLFRFFSFSSHDTPENIIKLIDEGIFDSMLVQYNLLDRRNEDAIQYAAEKGMAVFIMGPVGGGRLGMSSEKITHLVPDAKSTPELALRFVLSNPHVTSALSGMNSIEMVEENCATASRPEPLSADERAAIEQALEENSRLAELYCTGCNYCMPCPQGVGIPQAFAAMNLHRVWGLTDTAKQHYARLGPDNREGLLQADACVECGQCEEKCPQNIPIIQQLKETHEALAEQDTG
ncbi:MAG: aldo/keto reductase [Armatimonadetes bacterium]|nr:aldo/keto reductase [Armatimonadota bacterium]